MPSYKYFTREEFACPCCGENEVKHELLKRLDRARGKAGIPFRVNSGYRCHAWNESIGGSLNSAHVLGLAVDLSAPTSRDKWKIVTALMDEGFTRLGIYRSWIHGDISADHPQDVIWHG